MAIPSVYILKHTSGAVQAAELVGGGTINQIGADILVGTAETLSSSSKFSNRVVEYRGEIFVLAKNGSVCEVYGYNRGTTLWTSRSGLGNRNPLGLFIVNTSSGQRLVALVNSGTSILVAYTDDGSSWSTTADISAGFAPNESNFVEFGNKLYCATASSGSRITELDPIALTATSILPPFVSVLVNDINVDMCVYDDRLFCLTPGVGNAGLNPSNWQLYEFVGGNFTLNTAITTDNRLSTAANTRLGQSCLFQDPATGDLIAICNGTTSDAFPNPNSGSTAFRLTPSGGSFSVSDITNTVIPAGFRPGARGDTVNALSDRWFCYVSNDDTPSSPEVYLFFAQGPAPGTGYTTYTWNSVGSVMTNLATGPSTNYALPHQKFGGGGRVNKGSGNQCVIESATPVSGAYRISYRVYGTVSSQTVRLYYDLNQDIPSIQASISAQTGGSGISGGNAVTGITGDDGSTLFTLDWNLVTDGIVNGDIAHLMLDIR